MNGMKQSNQIAAPRFCRVAVGIPGKRSSIRPEEQSALLSQSLGSCRIEFFIRVHTVVYVFSRSKALLIKSELPGVVPRLLFCYLWSTLTEFRSLPARSCSGVNVCPQVLHLQRLFGLA
jgi:hypothetical protein